MEIVDTIKLPSVQQIAIQVVKLEPKQMAQINHTVTRPHKTSAVF